MNDIVIVRGYRIARIVPCSPKGSAWLKENILSKDIEISISDEFSLDLAEEIKKNGLEVEVK